MASFPKYYVSETEKRDKNALWARQWIDAIIEYHNTLSNSKNARVHKIQKNYDGYNGRINTAVKQFAVKQYGKDLSTIFTTFHLARTKIKLLIGEFIDIGVKATVETINPEAVAEKMNISKTMRNAMRYKPYLEEVAMKTGLKVLGGMPIPDPNSPEGKAALKPKRKNEIIMQRIINKFIAYDNFKLKLAENLQDLIITSEAHGKIERDQYGRETYRIINPKDAIFQEAPGDWLCLRTPFEGERRLMFKHEILNRFKLTAAEVEKIDKIGTPEGEGGNSVYENIDGQIAIYCYYVEWKTNKKEVVKTSRSKKMNEPYIRFIDPEHYERYESSFRRDVANKKYDIATYYKEERWGGWRIGQSIYAEIGPLQNQNQTLVNNRYRVESDFSHCLYGTVDGERISLQEVIHNLSEMYDLIMFIIKREVKKIKGKVYSYDDRFLPPGMASMKDVMYQVVEHGVIEFNSKVEAVDDEEAVTIGKFIQSVDLGLSQSFEILLALKADIERTVDKLTGINEAREGYSKASSTATGTMQNIEASRSISKDLFYLLQLYGTSILTKVANKTKINWDYLESAEGMFLNDDDLEFLKITQDISTDEFAAYLNDGRTYNAIKEFAMQMFPTEINAQQLRTRDVIEFKGTESLAEGLEVLDRAWAEVSKIRQSEMESRQKEVEAKIQGERQIKAEDREDWQAHEIEVEQMRLRQDSGKTVFQEGARGLQQTQQLKAQPAPEQQVPQSDIFPTI